MGSNSDEKLESAPELISARIRELGGVARRGSSPSSEDLFTRPTRTSSKNGKWRGTPVWSHDGIVCTGEAYKQVVKLNFRQGCSPLGTPTNYSTRD